MKRTFQPNVRRRKRTPITRITGRMNAAWKAISARVHRNRFTRSLLAQDPK